MIAEGLGGSKREGMRRELLHRYMRLQRELIEADPASSAYQATVQAFRQLGYALITNGLEEDLDRMLRIRVLEGGRTSRSLRQDRSIPPNLLVLERRAR
jgi:hypothetical protein